MKLLRRTTWITVGLTALLGSVRAGDADVLEWKEKAKRLSEMRVVVSSYVNLMKPHVTVLLLGTTVAAMVIARQSMPPFGLVLATLLGGAMAAGSANCINCYIDRDIDQVMGRTQRRSLP